MRLGLDLLEQSDDVGGIPQWRYVDGATVVEKSGDVIFFGASLFDDMRHALFHLVEFSFRKSLRYGDDNRQIDGDLRILNRRNLRLRRNDVVVVIDGQCRNLTRIDGEILLIEKCRSNGDFGRKRCIDIVDLDAILLRNEIGALRPSRGARPSDEREQNGEL